MYDTQPGIWIPPKISEILEKHETAAITWDRLPSTFHAYPAQERPDAGIEHPCLWSKAPVRRRVIKRRKLWTT